MKFEWKQNNDASCSLFVGATENPTYMSVLGVAIAYRRPDGWSGVVYSQYQSPDPAVFYGIETQEETKRLLETTVALRQG